MKVGLRLLVVECSRLLNFGYSEPLSLREAGGRKYLDIGLYSEYESERDDRMAVSG
jgi:hypothetical protein